MKRLAFLEKIPVTTATTLFVFLTLLLLHPFKMSYGGRISKVCMQEVLLLSDCNKIDSRDGDEKSKKANTKFEASSSQSLK